MTQTQKHTPGPIDRLNEWWQFGNKSDPAYAAGNSQFASDVGFLLKSQAELLAALKLARPHIGVGYSAMQRHGITSQVDAVIAKAERK